MNRLPVTLAWMLGISLALSAQDAKAPFEERLLDTLSQEFLDELSKPGMAFWKPAFSGDGKTVAWCDDGKLRVNGRRVGEKFARVHGPCLSADGSRVAFVAVEGDRWFAVLDGRRGEEFACVADLTLSPDGRSLAYWAATKERYWVVTGAAKSDEFDTVFRPVFSPDSRRVAFPARLGARWLIVVDGERGPDFEAVIAPVFSPDSKTVAYWAREGRKRFVVVGNRHEEEYESDDNYYRPPVFSRDGKNMAYMRYDGGASLVLNGRKGEKFVQVGDPVYSPDGRHVAHAASKDGGRWSLVLDGMRDPLEFDWVGFPVFSPDGERVAYTASMQTPPGRFVVVGNRRIDTGCDSIFSPLSFSPDGTKVGFGARRGRDLLWIEVEAR